MPHHMPLDRKWLHAQFNLGWQLVVHTAKKLWPWRERFGLERYQHNYVHEGLPPSTPAFRALAHEAGRCTSCGACDAVCPIVAARDGEFLGPMAFILSGARGAPHLDDVVTTLRVLTSETCTSCARCVVACPERIPILEVASVLHAQHDVIERARAALRASSPQLSSGGR